MSDIKNLVNSSTQINILKRALHAIALTQRLEDGVNWNKTSLADVFDYEEGSDVTGVTERAAATALKQADELFNVFIDT